MVQISASKLFFPQFLQVKVMLLCNLELMTFFVFVQLDYSASLPAEPMGANLYIKYMKINISYLHC